MKLIKYITIALIFILGCKSVDPVNTEDELLSTRYDSRSGTYYEDSWDKFINGVKSGVIVFTWTRAIVIYLISNVEIYDSRPEEYETDLFDRLCISFYILRWSW